MSLSMAFCVSLLLSIVLVPLFARHALRLGLVDVPDGVRKIHQAAIPRCGGIAIALSVLVPSVFFAQYLPIHISFILACVIIIFFGLLDDRFDLDYRWKFAGQIFASGLALYAMPDAPRLPFFINSDVWGWLGLIGIFFYLIATTNAVNLADGLDGLAGGTILLSLALIAYLAWLLKIDQVALVAIAVIGALLGFLRYNTHPASVFMGDTGSQFIGFTTAALSVLLTQDSASAISPLLPLLIIGLPLIDTAMVMTIRISQKRSPFSPDKNHIHHQLIQLGFRHYEAVAIIYLIQLLFILLAYCLRYAPDTVILMCYCTLAGFILVALYLLHLRKWVYRMTDGNGSEWHSPLLSKLAFLHQYGAYLILLLLATGWLFLATAPKPNSGSLMLITLVGLVLTLALAVSSERSLLGVRIPSYYASALAAYASWQNSAWPNYAVMTNMLTLAIALTLAFTILIEHRGKFRLDNQDLLVLVLLLGTFILPVTTHVDFQAGEMMLRLVVMLYAVEFLINCLNHRYRLLQSISCLTLLLFAINF